MCSGDKEREGMEDCPRIKKGGTGVLPSLGVLGCWEMAFWSGMGNCFRAFTMMLCESPCWVIPASSL